jgi:acetyl esterase/lipase
MEDDLTAGPQVPVDPAAAEELVHAAREEQERVGRARPLPAGVVLRDAERGEIFEPLGAADADPPVLYLHGGGYVVGSLGSHQILAARLALAARRPVHVLDYRQAPESPFPAGLDDAHAAYRALGRPLLAGDSAGGGMALALALRLRDAGEPLPAGIALIAPWLDLGAEACWRDPDRRPRNPLPDLDPEQLALSAESYAGTVSLDEPAVSPGLAERLAGLPPLLIHVAAAELLRPDVEHFAARAQDEGVEIALRARTGVGHVWHMGDDDAARDAIEDLGRWLAGRTAA